MANLLKTLLTYDPKRQFQDRKWKLSMRFFYILFTSSTAMVFLGELTGELWVDFWKFLVPAIAGIHAAGNVGEHLANKGK